MRIAKFAGLHFLSSSLIAAAQISSVEGGQVIRTATPACPLDMHVRQAPGGQMIATGKNGARVEMFEARLKLLLSDRRLDRSNQRMVTARVTVLGWNGKEQVLPIGAQGSQNRDPARMALTVPLIGGGLPDASADLNLPGFTGANLVELESITFEDGQVWSFKGSSACRAAPDPFMPVGHAK